MDRAENLTEFDWEKIFRQDDLKIRQYMEKLPKYIHIPGEDEIAIGEEIPYSEYQYPFEDFAGNDDDDNDEAQDDWKSLPGSDIAEKLLAFSRHWLLVQNAAFALPEQRRAAFKVTAQLAMASGRLIAAVRASKTNPNFAIAHCKRLRAELCLTQGLFRCIPNFNPFPKSVIIEEEIDRVAEISEMVSEFIFSLRKDKA